MSAQTKEAIPQWEVAIEGIYDSAEYHEHQKGFRERITITIMRFSDGRTFCIYEPYSIPFSKGTAIRVVKRDLNYFVGYPYEARVEQIETPD